MILRHHRNGHVVVVGTTRLDPTEHVLCEGSEDEVLRILISIYTRGGRSVRGRLQREFVG